MLKRGQVVRSAAGHDKDSFYVVVRVEADGYCAIADGKRRKLERPKRKNPRHLRPTREWVELTDIASDRALRRLLRSLRPQEPEQE